MDAQGTTSAPLQVGEAVGYGWAALKRYPGQLIACGAIVTFAPNLVTSIGTVLDIEILTVVLSIGSWVVATLLLLGFYRVALDVTAGREPEVARLFQFDGAGPFLVASLLFYLAVTVGLIFFIVPGIIAAVVWAFYGYGIVDRGLGIGEAFSTSAQITKGQRGTVFVLGLAMAGVWLLGLLVCCVGIIAAQPVVVVAGAFAYRLLSGQAVVPIPAPAAPPAPGAPPAA